MNFVQGHVECASSSAWRYVTHGQIRSMPGWRIQLRVRFLSMPIWHLLQIFPSLKLLYTAVEDVWHHHKDVTSSLIAANVDAGGTYHGCFSRGHLWKYETCIPQGTRKHVCVFVKILFLCFGLSDALSFQWHELFDWQHSWASVSDCFDAVSFWWCELSWSW